MKFRLLVELDLKSTAMRVKHMNIVNFAKGYTWKMEATSKDHKDTNGVFMKAFKAFFKAFMSNPSNKYTLRNLLQVGSSLVVMETGSDCHWKSIKKYR